MGNVTLTPSSQLTLREESALTVKSIDKIKNIDPVAIHLKEVNHIDPLSIDALHVSEVKNIEPLQIAKFNVTSLPMMNVSLQKLPPADIHVKSVPPLSIGTYQNFCLPSTYTLHARILGIELMRVHLHGQTSIIPKERARREQSRSDNQSFPTVAAGGNPAIPSHCDESRSYTGSVGMGSSASGYGAMTSPVSGMTMGHASVRSAPPPAATRGPVGHLSFGAPRSAFSIPDSSSTSPMASNRVANGA